MSRASVKRSTPSSFQARLKLVRERLGMDQEALAEKLAVSQQTISYWETGARTPSRRSWALIEHLLGYSQDQLEHGRGFLAPESGVFERGLPHPPLHLIPPRSGTEVLKLSTSGLSAESLTLAQAQKVLRESVKAGKPVWVVVG